MRRRELAVVPAVGMAAPAVGPDVTRANLATRVVASRDLDLGCHAEYVTVAEQGTIGCAPVLSRQSTDESEIAEPKR